MRVEGEGDRRFSVCHLQCAFPTIRGSLDNFLEMISAGSALGQETADWILKDSSFGDLRQGVEAKGNVVRHVRIPASQMGGMHVQYPHY